VCARRTGADDAAREAKHPWAVCACFNVVLALLFACLFFLLSLQPDNKHVGIFIVVAAALWLTVNAVLVQISRIVDVDEKNE